jgi:uncharacterized protein YlzI (FlbEa/FlbD family)
MDIYSIIFPIIPCLPDFPIKLFFGKYMPVKKNIEHVQSFKESVIKDISVMEKIRAQLEKGNTSDASCNYRFVTIRNGLIMAKATLDWCDDTLDYLKKFDIES